MACGFYVGTTQLDDGSPVPMLDVSGLARSAGMIREVKDRSLRRELRHERDDERELVPALMFRGFDGAERAVEMDAVRRIEKLAVSALRKAKDGSAQAVIDGRIVPLIGLGGFKPEGEEVNLFRAGEDGDERAYAYAEIVDLCEFDPSEVVTAEGASGQRLALIGGRPVELFDAAALLAGAPALANAEA
jgi:two-component system chemotaxis sensor kinase CheA